MSLSVCTGMWVLGSYLTKLFIIILFNRFVTDCCHFCCFFDNFIHVYIGTHVIFIAKIRSFISNGVQPLSPGQGEKVGAFVICFQSDPVVEKLSAFFMLVGLVFLTLAVLTFALFNSSSSTP